jgi:hypothetical protein
VRPDNPRHSTCSWGVNKNNCVRFTKLTQGHTALNGSGRGPSMGFGVKPEAKHRGKLTEGSSRRRREAQRDPPFHLGRGEGARKHFSVIGSAHSTPGFMSCLFSQSSRLHHEKIHSVVIRFLSWIGHWSVTNSWPAGTSVTSHGRCYPVAEVPALCQAPTPVHWRTPCIQA